MKKLLIIFLFPLSNVFAQGAASPPPHVVNSAGTTAKVGGNYYGYNIGEPIAYTGHNGPGTNYYTQGFLQPDYKIGTAFGAQVYISGESCMGANDGMITVNAFNNVGPTTLAVNTTGTASNNSVTGLSPGTYTITVQDSVGNFVTKVVTLAASTSECEDTVYHAFSPNGDGLNDVFVIPGIQRFADNHVYFFNRWGQLIWDGSNYDNVKIVWDGKDKQSQLVTSGTYYYIIERKGKKDQKSWVEVTR